MTVFCLQQVTTTLVKSLIHLTFTVYLIILKKDHHTYHVHDEVSPFMIRMDVPVSTAWQFLQVIGSPVTRFGSLAKSRKEIRMTFPSVFVVLIFFLFEVFSATQSVLGGGGGACLRPVRKWLRDFKKTEGTKIVATTARDEDSPPPPKKKKKKDSKESRKKI